MDQTEDNEIRSLRIKEKEYKTQKKELIVKYNKSKNQEERDRLDLEIQDLNIILETIDTNLFKLEENKLLRRVAKNRP